MLHALQGFQKCRGVRRLAPRIAGQDVAAIQGEFHRESPPRNNALVKFHFDSEHGRSVLGLRGLVTRLH